MKYERGLRRIPDFDLELGGRELADQGWQVFRLPKEIKNKQEFIQAVRAVLPLEPALVGDDNWDAFSDSLWGGLGNLSMKKIAIIWPRSLRFATTEPEQFDIAKGILSDLIESLADIEATVGNVKEVLIILE